MAELYHTATEYTANELTILRGSALDITMVGVYHTTDPNSVPAVADFDTVSLIDGATDPTNPLAEQGKVDVLSLIGPNGGDVTLPAGDYQRFVLVQTQFEDIIRKVDVLTIL